MSKIEKPDNSGVNDQLHQDMVERDDVIFMTAVFNDLMVPYMPKFDIIADEDESAKLLQNILSSTEKKWLDYQDVIAPYFKKSGKLRIVCFATRVSIWQYYVKFVDEVNNRFKVMYQPPVPEEVKPLNLEALERLQRLASAHRESRTKLAEQLKTTLNDFVKSVPQSKLDDKRKLGEWITAELAQYGLAVECPNTPGLPVEIKGDAGNHPRAGRFYFAPLEGVSVRKQRVYRDVLPELNFVQLVNEVDLSPSAKPRADQIEL